MHSLQDPIAPDQTRRDSVLKGFNDAPHAVARTLIQGVGGPA